MKGEEVYVQAVREIHECRVQAALWARAQASAAGDRNAAISHYVLYRIEQASGLGPHSQVILPGAVHHPVMAVRPYATEAANFGAPMPAGAPHPFLRPQLVQQSPLPGARIPVWPNPETSEALSPNWLRMTAPRGMPLHHHQCARAGAAVRRFVARGADLFLIISLLLVLVSLLPAESVRALVTMLVQPLHGDAPAESLLALALILSAPGALLLAALGVDAAVQALFGITPAKALAGVTLYAEGSSIGAPAYFRRNYQLWLNGLAMGLLPVTCAALCWQFLSIARGGAASHDLSTPICVHLRQVARWRLVLVHLLFGVGLICSLLLGAKLSGL